MAQVREFALIAQEITEQAPVTAWPQRIALTIGVVALTLLAVWAMRRNWRRRTARQAWVELPPLPGSGFEPEAVFRGRYVATVTTDDWLDRITAKGLGMPCRADIGVGRQGVLIRREGGLDLFLPAAAIAEVASARGMAQEVYESEGLVAITWTTAGRSVTTGLRMSRAEDHVALTGAVADMIGKAEV